MYVWTYCSERFAEIWEVRFTFKMPSSWTKRLEVKLKNNEYISVFPLIFKFPLNVLCSYKVLINSTCNSGLYRIYKHSYFLFFPAYNLSLIFCQLSEYLYFYKMKTCKKYHAERSKYPFHPAVDIFSFQPEVKGTFISKKFTPGWISPRLRVTCLLHLDLKSAWITLLWLDWF